LLQLAGVALDEAQPKVDVAEQASLGGRGEAGTGAELDGSTDVVQQCRCDEDVRPQPRMELCRLAAERRHTDRVLEQAAGVAVVPVDSGRRKRSESLADGRITEHAGHETGKAGMRDLTGQELEEAFELVAVATDRRGQPGGVGIVAFERANLHLQPTAEALDAPEHTHRVTLVETPVEKLHVTPHPCLDASTRVDELQRQIGLAGLRGPPLLARNRIRALDGAIGLELTDRGHCEESRASRAGQYARAKLVTVAHGCCARQVLSGTRRGAAKHDRCLYAASVADVQPYRFAHYATPSSAVVAPPYDVIGPEDREMLRARDPHNVVHLTLNPSEDDAGSLFRAWLADGTLVRSDQSTAWVVSQDYVGPDGVARTRRGLVASLAVEPYETRHVLPHERTHAGPKQSRLRLLRAARAQIEPIFLLYDGAPPLEEPGRPADLAADDTRLWQVDGSTLPAFFAERQLLIADGHHRYETALAYADEMGTPESRRLMVVLVSTDDPGLEIFPTHRLFSGRNDVDLPGVDVSGVEEGMVRLAAEPSDVAAAVLLTPRGARLVRGEPGELDVELVDRFGHDGISYTPDLTDAVGRVERGEADCAFLLRATRIEDVFERARRGEVMPQKTTYFFPKLLSGLLFHPLEP
jgi:uncharacterized protein (DUF1015 family)